MLQAMNQNPNLIFYACIAKGVTILAEFNSKDADLGLLAAKCLEKTPPFHSIFSHTVRSRTYMFFIYDQFVYFGIFDENLDKPDCLSFLKSVKDSFTGIMQVNPVVNEFKSHCFQGEFNPVFHQLLGPNPDYDNMRSPSLDFKDDRGESLERGKMIGTMPLLVEGGNNLKKKKKSFFGEKSRGVVQENKVDVLSEDDTSMSREFNNRNGLFGSDLGGGGHQKAKRIWKKQVLVVLSLDLIICCVLFAIWLWVCDGFTCMTN